MIMISFWSNELGMKRNFFPPVVVFFFQKVFRRLGGGREGGCMPSLDGGIGGWGGEVGALLHYWYVAPIQPMASLSQSLRSD